MVLVVGALTLCALVVLGFLAARSLGRTVEGWPAVLADSALAGLVVLVVVLQALELTGPVGAVGTLVAIQVAFGVLAKRRGSLTIPVRPAGWAWVAALVCLVAALLRTRPHVMMAWTGDQGAYVMNAVEFVNGFGMRTQFPKGFPLYMSVSTYLFGADQTVAGVPLLGVLAVVGVMRLTHLLRLPAWATLLAGLTMALHPAATYFSGFPGSESLQSVLTLAWFVGLVGLLRATDPVPWAAGALQFAMIGLALGLTRITAPVLLVPLVILLLATVAPRLRAFAPAVTVAVCGGAVGAGAALLLSLARAIGYTMKQLESVVPASLVLRLQELGLLRLGWQYPLALLAGVAVVAALGAVVARLPRPEPDARPSLVPPALVLLAISLCLLVVRREGPGEVTDALARYGWLIVLMPIGAVLLTVVGDRVQAVAVVALAWTASLFLYVHASRFDEPRVHEYFLYWDRYLYSEFLPTVVVLGACALGAAWILVARLPVPGLRWAVPLAGVAVVAVSFAAKADVYRNVFSGPQLDGVAALHDGLVDVVDEDLPLLWGAQSDTGLQPRFFPNTWQALGLTYARMYGARLEDVAGRTPFEPDPVLGSREAVGLVCRTGDDVLVAEVTTEDGVPAPQRWAEDGVSLTVEGAVEGSVSWLRQLEQVDERTSTDVEIVVYRLDSDLVTC